MPTSRKRSKASRDAKDKTSDVLLHDYRTCWLVKNDDSSVDLEAKDEVFTVHKSILTTHSEYFDTCLSKTYVEGSENKICFQDVEPRYLGYYLGLAASFSSIVPHQAPRPEDRIETTMRDFIEVYKLCDRFMSSAMAGFMHECIVAAVKKGHRGLRDDALDENRQRALLRNFADGYEALQLEHPVQAELAVSLVEHFCEGVSYSAWDAWMDEVKEHPRFVGQVSRGFARKLAEANSSRARLKRKYMGD